MKQHVRLVARENVSDNPFLLRLGLMTALDDADLSALESTFTGTRVLRGRAEFISAESERADRLQVVLDGWACRYRLLADGRRQITAILLPGDVCDLSDLYVRGGGFAAGTLTPCTIATLSAPQLRALIASTPRIGSVVGWLAAVETAMLSERNASLGRRSAREHIAHLLCELMIRTSVVGLAQGLSFALRMTQEEMADVLGLTAVHVNRVLQGLRAEGLIEQRGNVVAIRDWDALTQTAGFRADYLHLEGVDGAAGDPERAPWSFTRTSPSRFGF